MSTGTTFPTRRIRRAGHSARLLALVLAVGALAAEEPVAAQLGLFAPSARMMLLLPTSSASHLSHTWSLAKTGAVDAPSATVTWTVAATPSAPVSKRLLVKGRVTLINVGTAGATLGNVVVILQHKPAARWITLAATVADATLGNAATTALAVRSANNDDNSLRIDDDTVVNTTAYTVTTVTRQAADRLVLENATTHAPIPLVPQRTLRPGAALNLEVTAAFNNTVLALPAGRQVRAELIVTFGNAAPGNKMAANVDSSGNGVIGPDEKRVRSASARLGLKTVPPLTPNPTPVTLRDTLADITTTGTVTFSNPTFTLGATSGTVTATYDPGAAGGTITNCAHLTGTGISLDACDTQPIAVCQGGVCGWQDGNVITYPQGSWGDDPTPTNAAGLLLTNYNAVYASTFGVVEAGISGPTGFSMLFTDVNSLLDYLPALGPIGPLTSDFVNPSSTMSGSFGGHVMALRLNVDFSDAGLTLGAAGVPFGNLTLCNFTAQPLLNGLTVRQFLGEVNTLLGGGAGIYSIAALSPITDDLNPSFDNGVVSPYALDHLVVGACP